jgi:hypothetical protein
MESVLDVYKMPYNADYPVVCMDESPKQLIKHTRIPIPAKPGSNAKEDFEYERNGLVQIFMANEPLRGQRFVEAWQTKTKISWAHFIKKLSEKYPLAKKIRLIMDNLNTHTPGSLYETFSPDEAKRIWDRYEFIYTPKHGSWLNMAEIELHVLMGQCLNRRIENISIIKEEIKTWQEARNNKKSNINWQFTTDNARIKLKRLYPTLSN